MSLLDTACPLLLYQLNYSRENQLEMLNLNIY